MKQSVPRHEIVILFFLLLLYLLWFAVPVSMQGAESVRLVETFNVDEAVLLELLQKEIQEKGFNTRNYLYGHLYYNTGLIPLHLYAIFFPVTEKGIIIFFRLLSSLYFTGTILVIFLFAKRFFSRAAAWISVALLLITSPQLYIYSAMLHPDMAQLFFIALCLYFCCCGIERKGNKQWNYLAAASMCAGLAFSAKYAGLLLMPLAGAIEVVRKTEVQKISFPKTLTALFFCIVAVIVSNENLLLPYVPLNARTEGFYLLVEAGRWVAAALGLALCFWLVISKQILNSQMNRWMEKAVNLVLLSGIFLLAFAITSPGCVRGLNFIDGFITTTEAVRHGDWFRTSLGISGWLEVLVSKTVLNYPVVIVFFCSIFFYVFMLIRKFIKKPTAVRMNPEMILSGWIFLFSGTLIIRINAGFPHYLIPVIPFILLYAAHGMALLANYLSEKFFIRQQPAAAVIIAALLTGGTLIYSGGEILETREKLVNKIAHSDAVNAGLWLEQNFPGETIIVCDRYSYVSPQFHRYYPVWGITGRLVQEKKAAIVIINEQIYRNFSDPGRADSFLAGSREFLEKYVFYSSLLKGTSDFLLIKDFGKIKIYRKAG